MTNIEGHFDLEIARVVAYVCADSLDTGRFPVRTSLASRITFVIHLRTEYIYSLNILPCLSLLIYQPSSIPFSVPVSNSRRIFLLNMVRSYDHEIHANLSHSIPSHPIQSISSSPTFSPNSPQQFITSSPSYLYFLHASKRQDGSCVFE